MIRIPNIVCAHPATGIKSIPELIAYIKANPDKLNYGSSGVGQSPHLTGAWWLQLTGLKMQHVPFRGAGPALQAALAGDIQILFDNLFPSLPQVLDGKLDRPCGDDAGAQRAGAECAGDARDRAANWQTSTSRRGSACSIRRARRPRPSTRSTTRSRRCWRRTRPRRPSGDGRHARLRHAGTVPAFITAETAKFKGIIDKEGLQMEVK